MTTPEKPGRLCRDCKWFDGYEGMGICEHPNFVKMNSDLVYGGGPQGQNAYVMRDEHGPCGPGGKLWEEKK